MSKGGLWECPHSHNPPPSNMTSSVVAIPHFLAPISVFVVLCYYSKIPETKWKKYFFGFCSSDRVHFGRGMEKVGQRGKSQGHVFNSFREQRGWPLSGVRLQTPKAHTL